MNILVIDNCECLREFCAYILEQEGHNILSSDESDYWSVIASSEDPIDLITINVYPAYPEPAQKIFDHISSVNNSIKCILLSIPWTCPAIEELVEKGCHHLKIPFEADQFTSLINTASPIKIEEVVASC